MFVNILSAITFVDVLAALFAVAFLVYSMVVVLAGVGMVLQFVRGVMPVKQVKPPKGYEYEFVDKDGKGHYETWSKKDDYYHNKSRR